MKLTYLSIAASLLAGGVASASELVVVSYGGENQAAQSRAYYAPYQRQSGVRIIADAWNGEFAKIKAMAATGRARWDAVEVDAAAQGRGCEEGLLEKLDYKRIGDKADFVPGAAQPCAIGMFLASMVLAYNEDKLKTAPQSWRDFWDVKRFPGKRALRRGAAYTLEIALLADGVPPAQVYKTLSTPAGVDRAFRKLDQLKPYIQWWESGAQPPQYLLSGDVVMSSSYNGRISLARREGRKLRMVWLNNISEFSYWAIPKGSPNKDEALKFIAFASRPEQQKLYSEQMPYGPSNRKALSLLPAAVQADLPSHPANMAGSLAMDAAFWTDNGEALEQRFASWAAKRP